jgi:hypothetical protein
MVDEATDEAATVATGNAALRELVDLKDAGHYGMGNVSRTDAIKALRRATRLIEAATRRVR